VSSLQVLQSSFQDFVVKGDGRILNSIAGPDDKFRRTRADIYFNAYRSRLAEVLGKDFEILKAFVGDELFAEIASRYIDAHPSTFRNVRWFGQSLPAFLSETATFSHHQVLSELASFEWALGLAFDAADESVVTFETLAVLPATSWAGLRLRPHPSLHLLECSTNAVAIWQALSDKRECPTSRMTDAPRSWAIWRRYLTSYFLSLEPDAGWALRAMQSGASFPEICEGLCAWWPELQAAERAAALLREWVDQGWIAGTA
jgi:hypothetical protein